MLDSLDDRLLRSNRRFPNDLKTVLQRFSSQLAGCIIACRRAAFDPDWFRNSPLGLKPFHVDNLGHEEFGQILPDEARRGAFFIECDRLGISELLSMPFDGFYLARRFAAGQALPTTRRECLDSRIGEMLLGTLDDRTSGTDPPITRLRALARHLACLATFTEIGSWTSQDVVDHLSKSVAIRESETVQPVEVSRCSSVRCSFGWVPGLFLYTSYTGNTSQQSPFAACLLARKNCCSGQRCQAISESVHHIAG